MKRVGSPVEKPLAALGKWYRKTRGTEDKQKVPAEKKKGRPVRATFFPFSFCRT